VAGNLAERLPSPRHQANDNAIFGELAAATMVAISRQDCQFAITLFHDCYAIALQYEQENTCQVHKGAMAFNVALASLRANDFPSAVHYLELAEVETQLTTGDVDLMVYESDIFQSNFWQVVDLYQNESPPTLYADLWLVAFDSVQARADWTALQPQSKPSGRIARIRHVMPRHKAAALRARAALDCRSNPFTSRSSVGRRLRKCH
jgi:hypothetical protein